jgi:uncharacterized SAM-binding protein YcdF (DUF218 family)
MTGTQYVFVLGAPNLDDGTLSSVSMCRIDAAEQLYRKRSTIRVAATGGCGPHFNRTAIPHRVYAEDELRRRGVPTGDVSARELLSTNTVEDALTIAEVAQRLKLASFEIVTSAFHLARCQFVFSCICADYQLALHAAADPTDIDPELLEHEIRAMATLKEQNGVMVHGRLFCPAG